MKLGNLMLFVLDLEYRCEIYCLRGASLIFKDLLLQFRKNSTAAYQIVTFQLFLYRGYVFKIIIPDQHYIMIDSMLILNFPQGEVDSPQNTTMVLFILRSPGRPCWNTNVSRISGERIQCRKFKASTVRSRSFLKGVVRVHDNLPLYQKK